MIRRNEILKRILKKIIHPPLKTVLYRLNRNKVRVLGYHRFGVADSSYKLNIALFEKQCRCISEEYTSLSLSDYVHRINNRSPFPQNSVVITIDDGYKDFYDLAYPVLRKYNLKATIFITTSFVSGDLWLWPDMIRYIAYSTPVENFSCSLSENEAYAFDLSKLEGRNILWDRLSTFCLCLTEQERRLFIESIASDLKVQLPDRAPREFRATSWEDLSRMQEHGVEIGSHTVSHPILSLLGTEEKRREIFESKSEIQSKLGISEMAFCYPNGSERDIDAETVEMVKKARYICSPLGANGLNDMNTNLFRLPRMFLGTDEASSQLAGVENVVGKLGKYIKNRSKFSKEQHMAL